ncbi:MAG: NosD domain-containing protein, partial [Promethearchaeota archaeon]
MRKRSIFTLIGLILAVLLLNQKRISTLTSQISTLDSLDFINIRSVTQNYTAHESIYITNDSQLAAMANNGTGTVNDPYIIADWNITGSTIYGIYITGTTKHFRIENCWIVNSAHHGIFVDDVTSGTATICNNTCNNNSDHGIYLGYSSSLTVANNSCNSNNENGIYLEGSVSSTI